MTREEFERAMDQCSDHFDPVKSTARAKVLVRNRIAQLEKSLPSKEVQRELDGLLLLLDMFLCFEV